FLSYLQRYRDLRDLHSFPTRRSSDLFELGLFEDDDYLLRLEQAGFRVVCADDVLVHHFGQATIGALANGSYGDLFHANRRRFQEKWSTGWRPRSAPAAPEYVSLVDRVRSVAA